MNVTADLARLQWIATNLHIRTKKGELIRLQPNKLQLRLHMHMQSQRVRGLPVRLVMCKFRQWGGCLDPDTRVLTADLRWVRIADVRVGDSLVAVDEKLPGGRGKDRKMRTTEVEGVRKVRRPAYRIEFEDGRSVVCSDTHRWLSQGNNWGYHWRSIKANGGPKLRVGMSVRALTEPWQEGDFNDGWFGGITDGEGYFRTKGATVVYVSQKPGAVWDRIVKYAQDRGYNYYLESDDVPRDTKFGTDPVPRLRIGRMDELFHLFGQTRPSRFTGLRWWEGKSLPNKGGGSSRIIITDIVKLGPRSLIDLQTSHKTYIAEGFVSHNSTWFQAEAFYDIYHNANRSAMSVSVDTDSTENLFRMVQLYNSQLPGQLVRKMDNTNRKEIIFSAPHRSSFLAHTAGKMSLGRSFTAQYVLASEIAFWADAAGQMAGLNEVVPMEPGTVIVQETTGNGVGGYFYDGFMEAQRRRRRSPDDYSSYQPVFFGWNQFPDYAIEPPAGSVFSNDERRVQAEFNLTDAQLYWRQLKIAEKNGDLGLFHQEYPLSANESFLSSGSPVFAPDIIETQSAYLGESFRHVLFEESSKAIGIVPVESDADCWIIKELPCDRHDYAMGIDTMEGRLSNLKNPRSDLDHDGACIIDRNTGRVVAVYTGRSDQRELAQQCYRAAMYYGEAWVAPEIPQSMILLNYFRERGYQNLYNRQEHEDHYVEIESEKLGWRTTEISRRWLVEDFVVAAKSGDLKVVFPEIVEQMQTFVRDARGRPGHMQGEHDDLLFAAMIAWQVVRRCPLGDRPYRSSSADMGDPVIDEGAELNNLARIGAIDPDDDDDDEDEDQTYVE